MYSFKITEEHIGLGISGSLGFVIVLSNGNYILSTHTLLGVQLAFGYYGDTILFRQFVTTKNDIKFEKWKKIILSN